MSVSISYADIYVEFFSIGTYRIKSVHRSVGEKLMIDYFRKDATARDVKYKYAGIEIFSKGEKIKDTFREND
jgi:hypothetical protein